MSEYAISEIYPSDRYSNSQIDRLLEAEGIRRDANLDYTCGMYDDDMNIIATGSCFGNTLRCMAVSSAHQGEGLMNDIVSHLISYQYTRGNLHLFLYTTSIPSAIPPSSSGIWAFTRSSASRTASSSWRTGEPDLPTILPGFRERRRRRWLQRQRPLLPVPARLLSS